MGTKIYWLLLTVCFFISGCSHVQWVKNVYDPLTHKCTEHQIISSTQVMYFSQRKDIWAIHKEIAFSVGSTKQNPDFPPGFLDLFYKYVTTQADSNFMSERIK